MAKSESQMDIVEKQTKPRRQRLSAPLRLGAALLLCALTCAVVVLAVLYVAEREKRASWNVCITPECIAASARILDGMDSTVDPCQDFYGFACGGWLKKHVIPERSSYYSTFDMLRDDMEVVLKDVLERPDTGNREAIRKAKRLYRSCINESAIEERDSEPLLNLLDGIGDWPVTNDNWTTTHGDDWRLDNVLAKLNAVFWKRVIVDMYVGPDDEDSNKHVIHVDQPMLGLPSKDYYYGDGNYRTAREAYLQFMVSMATMLRSDRKRPRSEEAVREEMATVLELEVALANITTPTEERQDITKMYNKMALSELEDKFKLPGFEWTRFVRSVLASVNVTVPSEESVVVYAPEYLAKLPAVLGKYPARVLQNYIAWRLVKEIVFTLSQRYKEVHSSFKKALLGTTSEDARWRECVGGVNSNMENAVGSLYVRQVFAGESKQMVDEIIGRIRQVFIEKLDEMEWMDGSTKVKAQEKAESIKEMIGYPDYILDDDDPKLDEEYKNLNFGEASYFENTLENIHDGVQKSLQKLREPVNKDAWVGGAAEINAFYTPSRNKIVFPAGILQPPFFSKGQPRSLNYGGIGMVIGHEITHGFDDNGRNYDKDGNLNNWWSNSSAVSFKNLSRCMVHQYGNFTWDIAGRQNLSGVNTLGENIADNGGIRQAYQAFKKIAADEKEEPTLPGLNLNHKQLFFLNFAQVWCGTYRPESASISIKADSHSPGQFRVTGVLQNFEEFAEAFQCKANDFMSPRTKCRVW
ncbi:membrane metallo-endopeptidase-like 1 [Lampetra fluviatilis]